ncbi:hypothetical protein [Bradyrhizobium niftali]|uniref:hypothetical protein n=1 Tax=Bradyrhizobium niftali TaxID=2560055 RepID=UPI00142FD265|nr:hypothetical protein [Bradyrhizobium niftali]
MLLFIGPLLFVLLFYAAAGARQAGLSGTRVVLIVVVGSAGIVVLVFGILAWGFRDFG